MNIEQDYSRGRPLEPGNNQQRDSSMESYASSSSVEYAERVQTQSNKMDWAEQVEGEHQQSQGAHSIPLEEGMQTSCQTHVNDEARTAVSTPDLELLAIPYQDNQPTDLLLWDGNFSAISLFGTNEFLNGDTKKIACSLQRIAKFIKQRPLVTKQKWTFSRSTSLDMWYGNSFQPFMNQNGTRLKQIPMVIHLGNASWLTSTEAKTQSKRLSIIRLLLSLGSLLQSHQDQVQVYLLNLNTMVRGNCLLKPPRTMLRTLSRSRRYSQNSLPTRSWRSTRLPMIFL